MKNVEQVAVGRIVNGMMTFSIGTTDDEKHHMVLFEFLTSAGDKKESYEMLLDDWNEMAIKFSRALLKHMVGIGIDVEGLFDEKMNEMKDRLLNVEVKDQ